jgi:hypothetical protein
VTRGEEDGVGSEYEGGEGESSSDEEEEEQQTTKKKPARAHSRNKEKVSVCQPKHISYMLE